MNREPAEGEYVELQNIRGGGSGVFLTLEVHARKNAECEFTFEAVKTGQEIRDTWQLGDRVLSKKEALLTKLKY